MPRIPLKLFRRVANHFGDVNKARVWFQISNPVLNGMRPQDYHQNGKWDRLQKLIDDALKENEHERTKTSASTDST
jgi:hypothetical protein